jgi:AraC-like DNA-binding protein
MTFDTVLTNGEPCEEIEALIKWGYDRFELMNTEMKTGFAMMLIGAIKKNFALKARPSQKQYMLLLDIVEYISVHFAEPITLDVLAKRFGYDKTYISKIINGMLGMNLREYINSYRITMVNRMKAETPAVPLFKLGERCGFESANTFYRSYKRYG